MMHADKEAQSNLQKEMIKVPRETYGTKKLSKETKSPISKNRLNTHTKLVQLS